MGRKKKVSNSLFATELKNRHPDFMLVICTIILVFFGTIMAYSASASDFNSVGAEKSYFIKQFVFMIAGFVAMYIGYKFINCRGFYGKLSVIIFLATLVTMFMIIPFGKEVNGAKRWIAIANFQFQPVELFKIGVILGSAYYYKRLRSKMDKFLFYFVIPLAMAGVIALIIFFTSSNLSSALIAAFIVLFMGYVAARKRLIYNIGIIAAGLAVTIGKPIMGLLPLDGFRGGRIAAWINPELYKSKESYQSLNGLYAIGSGGFFGKGLGNGSQKYIIPEAQNDMIFTVLCEELGLFGMIMLLLVFFVLLYRIVTIAYMSDDFYEIMVCSGVIGHIAFQLILNIAVATMILPNTGVSLPFISYGGTALLATMAELGLVLSVSARETGDTDT